MAPREPKRWAQAAVGGLLVALGGALVGVGRKTSPAAAKGEAKPPSRSPVSKVRTKPEAEPPPMRTRYWPPPVPKPIEDATDGETEAGPVDPKSVELGFERHDARPGVIVTVMLVSVSLVIGAIAGLFFLIGVVHRSDEAAAPLTPQQRAVIVPPEPRLQDHPLYDIAMLRKRDSDLLTTYAWTDPQHRTARIPIARAVALVTGRPLDPLPADAAAAPVPVAPIAPAPPVSRP